MRPALQVLTCTPRATLGPLLQDWGPLLSTQANPHATLVTLFMNYLADMPELDPTRE